MSTCVTGGSLLLRQVVDTRRLSHAPAPLHCTVPRVPWFLLHRAPYKTQHTATRAVLFGAKLTTGGDHQLEPGSRGSCCCCVATFYSTTPFMDGVCLQNLGHFEILSEIYLFFATPFNNEANISKTTGILHENNGVIIWLPLSALIPNVRVIEDTVEVKLVSQGI